MSNGEYTTEQLIAISDLHEKEIKEHRERIVEIDKEFKNIKASVVKSAVDNVVGISAIIGILLMSDNNIQEFGSNHISSLIEEMNDFLVPVMDAVDPIDIMSSIYLKLMGILEQLIDKFGIVAIGLASKAITFITDNVKQGKKSKKLKDERIALEQKIKNFENIVNGKSR